MSAAKRKLTPRKALTRLRQAFQRHLRIGQKAASDLLTGAKLYDKAYELSSLIETLKALKSHIHGTVFTLMSGTHVRFRSKGGPINRGAWPFIEVRARHSVLAESWVDIECLALSAWKAGKTISGHPYGLAHELDIVVVEPRASGRPAPDELYVGVEAKHRKFNKALLKELLGVRRETAFASSPGYNPFAWWAADFLPTDPPSGIVLFCSDNSVGKYTDPADYWGIHMVYSPF